MVYHLYRDFVLNDWCQTLVQCVLPQFCGYMKIWTAWEAFGLMSRIIFSYFMMILRYSLALNVLILINIFINTYPTPNSCLKYFPYSLGLIGFHRDKRDVVDIELILWLKSVHPLSKTCLWPILFPRVLIMCRIQFLRWKSGCSYVAEFIIKSLFMLECLRSQLIMAFEQ